MRELLGILTCIVFLLGLGAAIDALKPEPEVVITPPRSIVEQYDDLNCAECGDRILLATNFVTAPTQQGSPLLIQGALAVNNGAPALQACSYLHNKRDGIIVQHYCAGVRSLPLQRILSDLDTDTFRVQDGVQVVVTDTFLSEYQFGPEYTAWPVGAEIAITIPEQNELSAYEKHCKLYFPNYRGDTTPTCTDVYPRTS